MSVEVLSLYVKVHKTQVAAGAGLGHGPVKVLREMQLTKNKKFFTNMFVSVQQQC